MQVRLRSKKKESNTWDRNCSRIDKTCLIIFSLFIYLLIFSGKIKEKTRADPGIYVKGGGGGVGGSRSV